MKKAKQPNALETLKAAREQLQAALTATEASEKRFAQLEIRLAALKSETGDQPIDALDRNAVGKRASDLVQVEAVEAELLNAEVVRAEKTAAIQAGLQAAAAPLKEIIGTQASTMRARIEDFLAPFCRDKSRVAGIASTVDGVTYLEHAANTWWVSVPSAQTAKWVIAELIDRVLSERPCLWPNPPAKIDLRAALA